MLRPVPRLFACLLSIFLITRVSAETAASAQPPLATAPVAVPPAVSVQAPAKGFASLAVYNNQGEMIRGLLYAQPVAAGPQSISWDGTTQLGLPAAPGNYHIRGAWFPEQPKINYAMKVGISGNPPYYTDDDRGAWGGCLGTPQDICANSKNLLAIFACVESPKTTGIQLMDLQGNILRRFTSFFGWDGRLACTMDEKNLYMAFEVGSTQKLFIGKYDLDAPPRGKILCELPVGNHLRTSGMGNGRWHSDVRGLALLAGRVYAPVFYDNKLFVTDASSGAILKTTDIPSPRGVAAHDGKLFVLSDKALFRLDADGALSGPPLVTGLDDPSGLAIDAHGAFYISDRGASQQVKVFSADGQPLRVIGRPGGRPRDGIYDSAGLLDPRGLCVAPDGKVWITSNATDFQTVTVWDSAGKPVKEFYNCFISSGLGRLSPDRSEMLATYGNFSGCPGITAYKIDWDHNSWAPSWHFTVTDAMMQQEDVLLGNTHVFGRTAIAYPRVPYLGVEDGMVRADNGRDYLVGGDFSLWLFDPATKQAKLASLVWPHRVHKTTDGRYEGDYDQGPNNWLTWSDLDGDGRMNLKEVNYLENPAAFVNTMRFYEPKLQPDLSIIFLGHDKPAAGAPDTPWTLMRLPPRKVLPTGVPVYDWNDLVKVVTLNVPVWNGGDGYKSTNGSSLGNLTLANGAAYVNTSARAKTKLHLTGVDGDGWWASRNWRMSPMKFDLKTGDPAWLKLGNRAAGWAQPGQMYYPGWGIAGSVDGINYVADALSQVWAWTDDGLYLGRLYNDNVAGAVYDANGIYVELTGSFAYKVNGKTYILTGDHGVSVHEVVIPKLTPLDAGTVTLTPAMAAAAKPWDPDGPPPGKRPVYVARSIYDFDKKEPKPTRTLTIDGRLSSAEWAGVSAMDLLRDGQKTGTVQVTFDKTNLYLGYTVTDANGLRNDGHELPYAPFVSGSYVDFVIGRDWRSADRTEPAEGDVRVILARITNATPATDYQMGFWPVRQNLRAFTPPPKHLNPQEIVSPAQKRHFDDISAVPGLTYAYQIDARGYTLEVSVPFASLGFNPSRNATIGFDASVAFTNASGQVRSRAVHWAGQSETEVVDRPGSAELKPATWGTLEFDRNPLPSVDP